MRDVKKLPYAGWLEESITLLAGQNVHSIGLAARVNDGEVLTAYYQADPAEKALLDTHIQADSLFEMTLANAKLIVEAAEDQENDDAEAVD